MAGASEVPPPLPCSNFGTLSVQFLSAMLYDTDIMQLGRASGCTLRDAVWDMLAGADDARR